MKIATILDQIDLGSMALPEFQRGYVWSREQVRSLMQSLYRKFPVGSLLVWVTKTETAEVRGDGGLPPGTVKLLLDGQQRVTSLYGIIRGRPPEFFEGKSQAFTGLHFNLLEEVFEFYAPVKMKGNLAWIDVTELMSIGAGEAIKRLVERPEFESDITTYINRLNAIDTIKEVDLHIEEVTGEDKTVDVVVDVFNRVNSGGTKLSKGDLALAKICAAWPDARDEMKILLKKWEKQGFRFRLEWLLRNVNTILTGEAMFSALEKVDVSSLKRGLQEAEKRIDTTLNLIAGRLGLDHDRVLGSRYSFPVITRYLSQRGGELPDHSERDKLLHWYIHTFLWGRYAGSTETVLNRDLSLIEGADGVLHRLTEELRQVRGDLRLLSNDFIGWSKGARFYPLLYMLTRVWGAKDWETGIELRKHMLGHLSGLQIHHIFPKAVLYKHGYKRPEVNAIANFTFLTQETNLKVSKSDPAEYLPYYANKHPGAIESHWIPMDPELWKIENYPLFLEARRELLANAANDFLGSLLQGQLEEAKEKVMTPFAEAASLAPADEEEDLLRECSRWAQAQGLSEGELSYELSNPETGEHIGIIDLAWPDGLQPELSEPVALLLDDDSATEEAVNQAGFRFFTSVNDVKRYVQEELLGEVEDDEREGAA